VADEIAFGPRQLALPGVEARVERWAAALGVEGLLGRPPFELSGGEKKRVALAAVLAIDPVLLLLDEVTSGLDPAWSARLLDLLAGLPGLAVVSATHNLSIAGELGDRAVLLHPDGRGVAWDGPPAALLADEALLVASGLAHRHVHRHGEQAHAHWHVHDPE
jgi:cobalt/nickel transport system ATP-binding protein